MAPPSDAAWRSIERGYLGVVYGAKGLWAHAYTEFANIPATEWVQTGLSSVVREMKRLQPVLASTDTPFVQALGPPHGAGDVKHTVKAYAGKSYVIVVNSSSTPSTVSLPLGGLVGPISAISQGSSPSLQPGCVLTDNALPGYGARVYGVTADADIDGDTTGNACDPDDAVVWHSGSANGATARPKLEVLYTAP